MSLLDEPDDIVPDVLPAPEPDDIEPELLEPDFMSLEVEDEPAPAPELVAGDEPDVLLLPVWGLADGDDVDDDAPDDFVSVLAAPEDFVSVLELGLAAGAFVSLPGVAGVFVSALEPLPPLVLAPALDEEPVPELLPPAPLCANADVASIAPATVSAKALIHVFIIVLLLLVC